MADTGTPGLTPQEARDLRRLAGVMIPADAEFGVPGADDAAIVGDLLQTLGRDTADVKRALAALAEFAGGSFGDLDAAAAVAVAMRLLAEQAREVLVLGRVVLSAYYRDARVVRSLGREPGPPFPRGHTMPPTDWSLLDPVTARAPFWRDDRSA
ncbi:MAG: hypothetical protein K2X74_03140 [Acetobacteraceae bacterium]|nr:hypothetical protein [Acetobacteraceae bacterium]